MKPYHITTYNQFQSKGLVIAFDAKRNLKDSEPLNHSSESRLPQHFQEKRGGPFKNTVYKSGWPRECYLIVQCLQGVIS